MCVFCRKTQATETVASALYFRNFRETVPRVLTEHMGKIIMSLICKRNCVDEEAEDGKS